MVRSSRITIGLAQQSPECKRRAQFPQKCRSKFPHPLRTAISRSHDQVSSYGDGPVAGERVRRARGSGKTTGCADGRPADRRARAGDTTSPRSAPGDEQRRCDHAVAKHLTPFTEAAVGSEDDGAPLVTCVHTQGTRNSTTCSDRSLASPSIGPREHGQVLVLGKDGWHVRG
jgi:hypothetical protein